MKLAESLFFLSFSCRFLAYFSTLKMEYTWSFKIAVEFHRITQSNIPEDGTLHTHFCEKLKSNIKKGKAIPVPGHGGP
jgi:hypothetical protein